MNSSPPRPPEAQPPDDPTRRSPHRFACRLPCVLEVLHQARGVPLTVPEIAERAELAPVTVRRHLARLREQGTVVVVGPRPRTAEDGTRLPSRGPDQYAVRSAA